MKTGNAQIVTEFFISIFVGWPTLKKSFLCQFSESGTAFISHFGPVSAVEKNVKSKFNSADSD